MLALMSSPTLPRPMPLPAALAELLAPLLSSKEIDELTGLHLPSAAADAHDPSAPVSRALLAVALNWALFARLLREVPQAQRYVRRQRAAGKPIVFDHGAVRTVAAQHSGALPSGEAAIARVLAPLGYAPAETYPLPRLRMTGRAWRHADDPQGLPQFFVSALHPEAFNPAFERTVEAVLSTSRDPLAGDHTQALLARLAYEGTLPAAAARAMLPALVACFARQHPMPTLAQYRAIAAESAEMAWISTEGQTFNHATDRVADVDALAAALRAEGFAIKDRVEVSSSGRVRQTALHAARVRRAFSPDPADPAATRTLEVPGSFFEFISRAPLPVDRGVAPALDLAFDAGNATGIFKMTTP